MVEFQRPNSICHFLGNYLNFFFFFLKQQWKKTKQIQTCRQFLETLCSADACFPPSCQHKPKSLPSWWQFLAFPTRGKIFTNCCGFFLFYFFVCFFVFFYLRHCSSNFKNPAAPNPSIKKKGTNSSSDGFGDNKADSIWATVSSFVFPPSFPFL